MVRQCVALLVTHSQEQLLIRQTRTYWTRATACRTDVIACAWHDAVYFCARAATWAASESTLPDRVHAVCDIRACLIAKTIVQLLEGFAWIAVVHAFLRHEGWCRR
jgi:hypothetical protein